MYPPLQPLHSISSLSIAKLMQFEQAPTEARRLSLVPGQPHCLKPGPMALYWMSTIEFAFFSGGVWT